MFHSKFKTKSFKMFNTQATKLEFFLFTLWPAKIRRKNRMKRETTKERKEWERVRKDLKIWEEGRWCTELGTNREENTKQTKLTEEENLVHKRMEQDSQGKRNSRTQEEKQRGMEKGKGMEAEFLKKHHRCCPLRPSSAPVLCLGSRKPHHLSSLSCFRSRSL